MADPNGNGNGNGRGLPARYLALLLALGPGAGVGATWWFTRDAREMLQHMEDEVGQKFDRDMVWRDAARADHEARIRALEHLVFRGRYDP